VRVILQPTRPKTTRRNRVRTLEPGGIQHQGLRGVGRLKRGKEMSTA
jgi:hypothetical protein